MPSKFNIALTYALLVFIWATTPLAIVWSATDLHPLWALALRFFLAFPIAILLLLILRGRLPLDQRSIQSYIAGASSFIGSQIFTYLAVDYLSSGLIALMFGLAPLITGILGVFIFKIRLYWSQWLGMVIALIGLAIISLGGDQQVVHPTGIVLMLMSVLIYCASIFWIKKINAPLQPLSQATGSITISTLIALCLLPFIWKYAPIQIPEMKSLLGLFYAVVMSSLLAMFCYFKLVKNIKATTLSLTTVLTPIIALGVGAYFNNEALTTMIFVGAFVLLTGLFVYFYKDLMLAYKVKK